MSDPHTTPPPRPFTIDPLARVSMVQLAAIDLEKMLRFYTSVIGLTILDRSSEHAQLGTARAPIIELVGGARARPPRAVTGLFHLALLLPSRSSLGEWLAHLMEAGYPLEGAGDHLVSEALYLSDPEDNGIEVYCDRPQETWEYGPQGVRMDTLPVDLHDLVRSAARRSFSSLPDQAILGHIHLKVGDVPEAIEFYQNRLGFELMASLPGAGFLSAGGYHHHIGVNAWRSRGAGPAPAGSSGLISFTVQVSSETARRSLLAHLTSSGVPVDTSANRPNIHDPAGIGVKFTVV